MQENEKLDLESGVVVVLSNK